MASRGGVAGGPTIRDFLWAYARDGFDGSFVPVRGSAALRCCGCEAVLPAREVRLLGLRRYEGASEPDSMGAVAALECPRCGARGTTTFCVGPSCPPEDGAILRALDNQRVSSHVSWEGADPSLVRDTGWIERRSDEG